MAKKFNTGTRGGSALKEGIYLLKIIKAEEKVAQSSGNDMISMQLSALRNGSQFGPLIYDNVVLSEAAEWRLIQLMDALEAPENMDVDASWLEGQTVYARLTVEDYQDETRNKVTRYMLPAVARKQLAKEQGDSGDVSDLGLSATDSGAKARGRGRPSKEQPAEFSDQEAMPI
jgi:hypothetical protein